MLFRTLASASLVLAVAALVPFAVGCDSMADMSAPVAAADLTTERADGDPASDDFMIFSPSVLSYASQGDVCTVHMAISFYAVETSTLHLDYDGDSLVPAFSFADDCGDLVCKFNRADVFALVGPVEEPTEMTLTLSGLKVDSEPFSGTDTITVR